MGKVMASMCRKEIFTGFGKATWTKETNCKAEVYLWNICSPGQEWKTGYRRNGNYFGVKDLPTASIIQSILRLILILFLFYFLTSEGLFPSVSQLKFLSNSAYNTSHHIRFNFCTNIWLPTVIMKLSFRSKYFLPRKHANYSAATIYAYQ